jgi:hypothetical protein
MGVAYHPGYARQGSDFLGRPLCVTTGDQNPGLGVFPMGAANCSARILVGCGSDCTGVEDNQVGLGARISAIQTLFGKLSFYGGPIRLRGAAAKVLHKKGRHRSIIAIDSRLPWRSPRNTNSRPFCLHGNRDIRA